MGLVPVSISLLSSPERSGSLVTKPVPVSPTAPDSVDILTEREREIYKHLKAGKKLTEIAELCTI
jgi:DNA-binding NarL/FixJ family response regulator